MLKLESDSDNSSVGDNNNKVRFLSSNPRKLDAGTQLILNAGSSVIERSGDALIAVAADWCAL